LRADLCFLPSLLPSDSTLGSITGRQPTTYQSGPSSRRSTVDSNVSLRSFARTLEEGRRRADPPHFTSLNLRRRGSIRSISSSSSTSLQPQPLRSSIWISSQTSTSRLPQLRPDLQLAAAWSVGLWSCLAAG